MTKGLKKHLFCSLMKSIRFAAIKICLHLETKDFFKGGCATSNAKNTGQ